MPRTGAPPMIGETPTTVLARTAPAIPGTARMAPTLTTGLDGGSSTQSAAAIASSTPGAGAAVSAPVNVIAAAGTAACIRTHHSWKCTVRRPPPAPPAPSAPLVPSARPAPSAPSPASVTWVSTRSSVIGSRMTPGCHRSLSARVTADSGRPARSMPVRAMCVAKSRSPRLNQPGPAP